MECVDNVISKTCGGNIKFRNSLSAGLYKDAVLNRDLVTTQHASLQT